MNDSNLAALDIDQLMERIRDEVTQRRPPQATAQTEVRAVVENRPRPVATGSDVTPPSPVRLVLAPPAALAVDIQLGPRPADGYHLNDLVRYDDDAFVRAAYQATLGREADADGLQCYGEMLRAGASKVEILGRLCQSPEGRQKGAAIVGMGLPYALDKLCRWPIIGRVISIAVAIWNLPGSERRYRRLASTLAHRLAAVEQAYDRTGSDSQNALHMLERSHNALADFTKSLAGKARLETLQRELTQAIASVQKIQATLAGKVEQGHLDGKLREIREHLDAKADYVALLAANRQIQSIAQAKADRAELERRAIELGVALQDLATQHRATLDALDRRLHELSRAKVDHAAMVTVTAELTGQLHSATDALRAESKDSAAALLQSLNRLDAAKMDREAVQVLLEDLTRSSQMALSRGMGAVHEDGKVAIERGIRELREALAAGLGPLTSQARDLRSRVIDQERRLGLLLEEARKRLPKPLSGEQLGTMLAEGDHRLDAMYASFEDIFRGTRADIRNRQTIYLPYIRAAKAGVPAAPVIDLGCGRGEWLELLKDEGLAARGVDTNRIFLEGCRELDLDVVEDDVLGFLRGLKPSSVGAITSYHLIEHLPHDALIAIIDESMRVLRPGGLVIFETPNPRNLVVAACNFYLDPTHRRPLPPELSKYILEARGFVGVEIKELHPCAPDQQIMDGSPAVRDTLNRLLFSSQDYAVIGRKA